MDISLVIVLRVAYIIPNYRLLKTILFYFYFRQVQRASYSNLFFEDFNATSIGHYLYKKICFIEFH